MKAEKKIVIVPANQCPEELVASYWQALVDADTFKYRFAANIDVTVADAIEMRFDPKYLMFCVLEADKVVAEFALENFTGKAAQIHFSMHPDNPSLMNFRLAKSVTGDILNTWLRQDGEPYLHTLYGLTPVDNTVACRFIQKVGFEKLAILPSGISYLGETTDALLTFKEGNIDGR